MALQSALLSQIPGVVHGFGTWMNPLPEPLSCHWEQTAPQWKQVHGTHAVRVDVFQQECGDCDALYTDQKDIPIAVKTADCVPILLARRDGQMIAAIHAGWRGVMAHIVEKFWEQRVSKGEHASEWVGVVGPCIGPCCYEVSLNLAHDFTVEFQALGSGVAVPRGSNLDLAGIQRAVLEKLGFSKVESFKECTFCSHDPVFSSHRRTGNPDRQYSGLKILKPQP